MAAFQALEAICDSRVDIHGGLAQPTSPPCGMTFLVALGSRKFSPLMIDCFDLLCSISGRIADIGVLWKLLYGKQPL